MSSRFYYEEKFDVNFITKKISPQFYQHGKRVIFYSAFCDNQFCPELLAESTMETILCNSSTDM